MKTKISILFYASASNQLKSGLVPIYLRITVNGKRIEISTNKFIEESKWNKAASKLKDYSEEARTINSYLDILKNKVYETEKNMVNNDEVINANNFRNKFIGIEKQQLSAESQVKFLAISVPKEAMLQ